MGAMEVIRNYEELQDYKKVGSPFSIPKAALRWQVSRRHSQQNPILL